uniref:Uncharacterized protein n=1 Tax=Arundo donax TaxID=35708 RepID=A0A0A9EWH5_ARUDO
MDGYTTLKGCPSQSSETCECETTNRTFNMPA